MGSSHEHHQEEWKNVFSILKQHRGKVSQLLTDDDLRVRIQFFAIYVLLAVASVFMTVMNILTGWHTLTALTACFSVVTVINFILSLVSEKAEHLSRVLFSVEIILLFGLFVIIGDPQGFSAIWILLLPTCGMLLYRLKTGVILSLIEFLFLVVVFWTPLGNSILLYQEYTLSFKMRFPVLYLVFLGCGAFFEFLRSATQKELVETRAHYKHLSNHDILTGLFNRSGFNEYMTDLIHSVGDGYAFAIIDIDDFKQVNDRYGHSNGDIVLTETAKVISEVVGSKGKASRWGGEEFAILFNSKSDILPLCEKIRASIQQTPFTFLEQSCSVTVSIGLTFFENNKDTNISQIFSVTDDNLYTAKKEGKNRVVSSTLPSQAAEKKA